MHHALISLRPKDNLVLGGLNIAPLVPGRSKGTRLKLCAPLRKWKAESLGWMRELYNMFSESCACRTNLFHNNDGKHLSQTHRPVMKWVLKVWIAHLEALARWLCGSTSCILISADSR